MQIELPGDSRIYERKRLGIYPQKIFAARLGKPSKESIGREPLSLWPCNEHHQLIAKEERQQHKENKSHDRAQ